MFVVIHDRPLIGVNVQAHLALPLRVSLRVPIVLLGFSYQGLSEAIEDDWRVFRDGGWQLLLFWVNEISHIRNGDDEARVWR